MTDSPAKKIYARAVALKKYDSRALRSRLQRAAAAKELVEIHRLAESLLRCLRYREERSSEHFELALLMSRSLLECAACLASANRKNRTKAEKYFFGFHNLPRAFLPEGDSARITPAEAAAYFRCYVNIPQKRD